MTKEQQPKPKPVEKPKITEYEEVYENGRRVFKRPKK
jgi:hypothetical protein